MKTRKLTQILTIGVAVLSISSCSDWYGSGSNANNDFGDSYHGQRVRVDPNTGQRYIIQPYRAPKTGYHFQEKDNPTSHAKRDSDWAGSQQGYTIELADDTNPANVARTLHKTPKYNRTAQYRYTRNGKTHYRGVYGSFKNREEAQKALGKLPESVRNNARVRSWNGIKPTAASQGATNQQSTPPILKESQSNNTHNMRDVSDSAAERLQSTPRRTHTRLSVNEKKMCEDNNELG